MLAIWRAHLLGGVQHPFVGRLSRWYCLFQTASWKFRQGTPQDCFWEWSAGEKRHEMTYIGVNRSRVECVRSDFWIIGNNAKRKQGGSSQR